MALLWALLLSLALASSGKNCTMSNMEAGDKNVTSEAEMKQ